MCNIKNYMYLQSGSSCTGFPSMLNVFSRLPPLWSPGIRLSVSKKGIFHYLVHLVVLQRTEKKCVAACSQVVFLHSTNHNIHLWRCRCPAVAVVICKCLRYDWLNATRAACTSENVQTIKDARTKRAKWLFILSLNMPANLLSSCRCLPKLHKATTKTATTTAQSCILNNEKKKKESGYTSVWSERIWTVK